VRMIESFPPGEPVRDVMVSGGHAATLFQIARTEVALALWHRPLPGDLAEPVSGAELASLARADFAIGLEVVTGSAMDAVAAALPVSAPLHFLIDMITLVGLFVGLTGVSRVALRLASWAGPEWPGTARHHRLLTHYVGAPEDPVPPGCVAVLKPGVAPPAWGAAARLLLCLDAPAP
jgi:hypothetical protein